MLAFFLLVPAAGALLLLFFPEDERIKPRVVALGASGLAFFVSILVFALFDPHTEGYQFVQRFTWIDADTAGFTVQFALGVDGLSAPLVLLTGLLSLASVLVSWNIELRPRQYFAMLLLLETAVAGVFTSLDLIQFFFFWELELLPMYLLISIWGSGRKEYSAMKFLLYTIGGSALMVVGFLLLGLSAGTFDIEQLAGAGVEELVVPAGLVFWLIMLGFLVKLPVFPLHTWLPDAHTDAPTAVSVMLAGVLLKMGGYGMLRIPVSILPESARTFATLLATIAGFSVVYGAILTLQQRDLKRLIAYSSVSHMGYVLLGVAALTPVSMSGASLQMFTHGTITGLLFIMVGLVYDRAHTRQISDFGGLMHHVPFIGVFMMIAGLASLGLPTLSGFVAELTVFLGSWDNHPVATLFAVFGVVLAAAYILWMAQRVFFGPPSTRWASMPDATAWWERTAVLGMTASIVVVGIYPAVVTRVIEAGVEPIAALEWGGLMGADLNVIAPALILYAGAAIVLLVAIMSPRALRPLAVLALVLALAYAVGQGMAGADSTAFSGAVRVDAFSVFFAVLVCVATLATVLAGAEWADGRSQRGEYYSLLLISAGSMLLLTQANDLIAIFVALETTSIAQFILTGIARDDRSSEAGLKYLLYGAVSAAVLLYGFAFLFGLAGATSLEAIAAYVATANEGARMALLFGFILVTAGLGFKMALFPFHAWTPDVYQGAPTSVTTFLSVASKAAGFGVVLRVFYAGLGGGGTFIANDWAIMFGVLAALSMTFGNIAAIMQTDVKRLLGYSSIAQAGNIAIGLAAVAAGSTVGASGVLFFLGTYLATNLGAFVCVIAISQRIGSDDIRDYAGLARRSPWLAGILTLCLLSLTGIPPTAGFLAKLYIFNSAIQAQGASTFNSTVSTMLPPAAPAFVGDLIDGVIERWLVIIVAVAVLNTALSAFYYLRWARTMILDEPRDTAGFRVPGAIQGVLALAAVGVLLFGLMPTPLITAARHAADALL